MQQFSKINDNIKANNEVNYKTNWKMSFRMRRTSFNIFTS